MIHGNKLIKNRVFHNQMKTTFMALLVAVTAPALRDGAMSFARGRLYIALEDGQLMCLVKQ